MSKNILFPFLVFSILLHQSCKIDDSKELPKWSLLTSGIPNDLKNVLFTNPNCGYILSWDTILLKTENAGMTWCTIPLIKFEYNGMFFTTDSIGYLSTANGLILKTSDGGNSWQPKWNEINYNLTSIFFSSQKVGYVVGGKYIDNVGVVLKTDDGGETWSDLSGNISTNWIYTVYFTDKDIGFAAGNSDIFKTVDGGKSWKKLLSLTDKVFTSAYFTSKDIGYISGGNRVGDDGIILKTIDGGDTWVEAETGTRSVSSIFFINNSTGYSLSYNANLNGIILKTENSGSSWSIVSGVSTDVNFSSLFFTDLNHGYLVGQKGTILCWSEKY